MTVRRPSSTPDGANSSSDCALRPVPPARMGPGRTVTEAGPGVGAQIDLAQVVDGDQGVDLRRGHRGVAQQLLHHPDVGAAVQQVGGVGVPQGVRRHVGADAGPLGAVRRIVQALCRDSRPPRVLRNRAGVPGPRQASPGRARIRYARERGPGVRADRHDPLLAALAEQPQRRCRAARPRPGSEPATSSTSRPTASEIRAPVRTAAPAARRRAAPAAVSAAGSSSMRLHLVEAQRLRQPAGGWGGCDLAAGSSAVIPSSTANRCRLRTATTVRAVLAGPADARPSLPVGCRTPSRSRTRTR